MPKQPSEYYLVMHIRPQAIFNPFCLGIYGRGGSPFLGPVPSVKVKVFA